MLVCWLNFPIDIYFLHFFTINWWTKWQMYHKMFWILRWEWSRKVSLRIENLSYFVVLHLTPLLLLIQYYLCLLFKIQHNQCMMWHWSICISLKNWNDCFWCIYFLLPFFNCNRNVINCFRMKVCNCCFLF